MNECEKMCEKFPATISLENGIERETEQEICFYED